MILGNSLYTKIVTRPFSFNHPRSTYTLPPLYVFMAETGTNSVDLMVTLYLAA